jgi:hypothetical protein
MKEIIKVAVLIASRGLVHTRTMECVHNNLNDLELYDGPHPIIFSHNRPIPDAQNYLIEEALKTDADYFWFVEEDNTFPPDTLFRMLAEQVPVIALDYPVGPKAYSTIMEKDGKIWWCGLGCTLFERYIFEVLPKPWFRTDTSWRILNPDTMELVEENVPNKYGGQDINLGMELKKRGIPIAALKGVTGGHLQIVDATTGLKKNSGAYNIIENTEIRNYQRYRGGELK